MSLCLSSRSLSRLISASVCFAATVCVTTPVVAETPEEVMQEIVTKIKAEENSAPIVEYVDWDSAYAEAPEQQKQLMQLDSPVKLKEFYREVLKNPAAMMKKHVEMRMSQVPEDQQAMMRATVSQMETVIKKKEAEMKDKIAKTEYNVGTAKITGDDAVVPLTTTFAGEEKTHDVDFVLKDGKWLLSSPGFAVEQKAPPVKTGGAVPSGMLKAPPAAAPASPSPAPPQ